MDDEHFELVKMYAYFAYNHPKDWEAPENCVDDGPDYELRCEESKLVMYAKNEGKGTNAYNATAISFDDFFAMNRKDYENLIAVTKMAA